MRFQFADCRAAILRGILAALDSHRTAIKRIERTRGGRLGAITGFALDLAPWHGGVGLAPRLSSDPRDAERRYSSVEWEFFNFISTANSEALVAVGEYIRKAYRSRGKRGYLDMAHLIFLAGAEALLDKRVAATLAECGVDAPVVRNRLGGDRFDYIVVDPDGTIHSNYCELVLAMRVTKRLLK